MSNTLDKIDALTKAVLYGDSFRLIEWPKHKYVRMNKCGTFEDQWGNPYDVNVLMPGSIYELYTPPKEEDRFNMQFMQAMKKYKEGWKVGRGKYLLDRDAENPTALRWDYCVGSSMDMEDVYATDWRTFGKWEDAE